MRIEKSQLRGQSFNYCNQDLGAYLSSFHPPVVLPHPDGVIHGEPGLLVAAAVPGLEALPQATVAALVPLILVHRAVARKPTAVCMLLSNTPSKKSFAAVARSCSIVFSCSSVSTYGTVGWNDSTLQMVTIIHLCILKYNWNYCQHSFLILT